MKTYTLNGHEYSAGQIIAVPSSTAPQRRRADGNLTHTELLFLVCEDIEHDALRIEPIGWLTAHHTHWPELRAELERVRDPAL
jgi:hypothetical protein